MIATELYRAVGRWTDWVSPRLGLIREVSPLQRGAEEPSPPFLYHAVLSHFDFRAAKPQERAALGKGRTPEEAIRGAFGEAIERYCASHFDTQATQHRAWPAVSDRAIPPPDFVLYSPSQYKSRRPAYRPWDPEDKVTWLPARELPEGREVLVPASLVYLQMPQLPPEDAFTPATSNGLAAGRDLASAILSGLYECIERDAFLITWMARLPAPEIEFTAAAGLPHAIREHYRRFGTEVRVFQMCTDVSVHVMMAVALDRTDTGPAALVGLGCHANPSMSLLKALFEICQVHPGEVRRYRQQPPADRLKKPEDVRTLEDHSAWLTVPERLGELAFLLENGRRKQLDELPDYSTGSLPADLDRCVAVLRQAGCRVLYADLTTSDVADYGISVVRAFATGLQPIHFGYGEERLGGTRLFELPQRLGLDPRILDESDLNPCPHPLA